MSKLKTVHVILMAIIAASAGAAAQTDETNVCVANASCWHDKRRTILWDGISAEASVDLPIKPLDSSVTRHTHETRGFLQVPVDDAKPNGACLEVRNREDMEASFADGIQQSVNLPNYVLSSSALAPGYTDRSITIETSRRVPLDDWMLDENWTLNQIGNDGTWRENFIQAVDADPPPATEFPSVEEIRSAFAISQILFTFGKSDAFLPQDLQLNRTPKNHVPGRTAYCILSGGHGAAFSEEGADVVARWADQQIADGTMNTDFEVLMSIVSDGWNRQDTDLALSAFSADAVYTEPPNSQFYNGQDELRRFFDAVRPGSTMIWHNLWFDSASGVGAGEYSFHNGGRKTAAHGVAVVHVRNQKISVWREYQQRGAIDFDDFHQIEGREWATTVEDFE